MKRVLAALVALGPALALAGLGTGWWLSRGEEVPVPPDDASAEQVVAAYVAARNGRDAETIAGLRVDEAVPGTVLDPPLLEGRTTCRDLEVGRARADLVGGPVTDSVRAVHVPVRFVLDRTPAPFPDVSMPQGPTGWGYVLERASPSDPWRVAQEGVG